MANRNENGKPTIQMCSLPKRRRQRFFLICGSCNVVSIAENTPTKGKAGENNIHMEEEKSVIAVREDHNEDNCEQDDVEESFLDFVKEPKRAALQDVDKLQTVDRNDHGTGISQSTKKICRSSSYPDGYSNHAIGQTWTQQSQDDIYSAETSLQLHEVDKCKKSKEARTKQGKAASKRPNLTRQRIVGSIESSQSQGQLLDQPEVPHTTSLTENSPRSDKQASNMPEIKIDSAVTQPASVEDEKTAKGPATGRWKRVAAIKWKLNRVQGKKMERDVAVANEEYEMMMENLTMYGVL